MDWRPLLPVLVPAAAAVLAAGLALAVAGLLARRRRRADLRDVVAALEELRSGRARRRIEVDEHSPLALVADAVNRLGQDLQSRWAETEHADEGLRAVLEAARDYAVVATDADWDVLSFSPGAAAMFGWESGAILGRSVTVLFDEAAWKDLLPRLARRDLRERGAEGRFTMVRRDAERFPARVTVRVRRGSGSDIAGFLLVVQDVSVETRLEADLRASESRYRRLVEGLPQALAVVRRGCVVYANPAFGSLLGLSATEASGLRLRDRVATPDVLVLQEALGRLEQAPDGTEEVLHLTLAAPGGAPGATVRAALAKAGHDGEPAVVVTIVDETAEVRLEAELRDNESRLDSVVEAASEGLLVLADTAAGSVVRMTNRSFLELAGLSRERVLGATEGDLLRLLRERGRAGAAIASAIAAAADGPRRDTVEAGGSGAPRSIEVAAAPLRGRSGALDGRVVVLRDLSDARAAERSLTTNIDALRRGQDELEAAYRELVAEHEEAMRREGDLEKLNQELRALDSMKSDLLANVSHELQTPLVSIRGYTEMMLKGRLGPVTEEQRKGLGLALKNVDRLIGLIDNLLAFARMDREVGELTLTTFPLAVVVDEAIDLLRERFAVRRITVAPSFEDPALTIRADRDKILQVFLNLLSNAAKFNRDEGRIEVDVRRGKPGFALVQVHDTGVGIPEQDLERIFDRFFQAETAGDARSQGSGIGLAIVRSILRLHGCVIQAASRIGEGTTFSFTLPLAGEPAEQGERRAEPPPAPAEPAKPARGEGIAATQDAAGSAAPVREEVPSLPRPRFRVIRRATT